MKKYIFTESQIKHIIDSVISEQTTSAPTSRLDKNAYASWNYYMNKMSDEKQLRKSLMKLGLATDQQISDYLYSKPNLYNPTAISKYLKNLGLKQYVRNIDTSDMENIDQRTGRRKLRGNGNTGLGGDNVSMGSSSYSGGGSLGSTGQGHIPRCSGGGCKNLKEQQEEQKQTKAVQNFLNTRLKANLKVDGIVGPATKQAIEKYQQIIGVFPTDGVWGQDTYDKMPKNDKKIYDDYLSAGGDIIDKVLNLLR